MPRASSKVHLKIDSLYYAPEYQAGFAVPARLALIGKTDLAESRNLDDALLKIFLCHLAIGQSLRRSRYPSELLVVAII